jgi:hypothetical protein
MTASSDGPVDAPLILVVGLPGPSLLPTGYADASG